MVSGLGLRRERSGTKSRPRSLCYVVGQDTSLSQYLSPVRCMIIFSIFITCPLGNVLNPACKKKFFIIDFVVIIVVVVVAGASGSFDDRIIC